MSPACVVSVFVTVWLATRIAHSSLCLGKDGSGKLWNDVFADSRLLLMPPSACALLVLLNRNHNYIAERMLRLNENGNLVPLDKIHSAEERRAQDDELFERARLVNCGFFMQIILQDYVGAILGLARDAKTWRLPVLEVRYSGAYEIGTSEALTHRRDCSRSERATTRSHPVARAMSSRSSST